MNGQKSRRCMGPEILTACRTAAGNTETGEEEVTIETVGAQIETDHRGIISYTIAPGVAG